MVQVWHLLAARGNRNVISGKVGCFCDANNFWCLNVRVAVSNRRRRQNSILDPILQPKIFSPSFVPSFLLLTFWALVLVGKFWYLLKRMTLRLTSRSREYI